MKGCGHLMGLAVTGSVAQPVRTGRCPKVDMTDATYDSNKGLFGPALEKRKPAPSGSKKRRHLICVYLVSNCCGPHPTPVWGKQGDARPTDPGRVTATIRQNQGLTSPEENSPSPRCWQNAISTSKCAVRSLWFTHRQMFCCVREPLEG